MIAVEITGRAGLVERLRTLSPSADRAIYRAINKAATTARKLALQQIRREVNLSAAYVREKLTIRKANKSKLVATISAPPRQVLLTRYKAIQKKTGISVKVKAKGQRKLIEGAFFAKLRRGTQSGAGALGVVARSREDPKKLKVFYGPSVHQVFVDVREKILPEADKRMSELLLKAIERELNRR